MDPAPTSTPDLLDDYLALSLSLPALAKRHALTLRALIDFLDNPETQRTLADLRRLAAQRAEDASVAARAPAIETLVLHATADPSTESARRAATELLRDRVRTRRSRRAPSPHRADHEPEPDSARPPGVPPEWRALLRTARARVREHNRTPRPDPVRIPPELAQPPPPK